MAIRILGIRGIPGRHGGFESFAEDLALHLVERGWTVTVYCQKDGQGPISEAAWRGVRLVQVPVRQAGALGTMIFDWKCTLHAARARDPVLVLGYNTAVFNAVFRIRGVRSIVNMDGLEWKRRKYGAGARVWLWMNEWLGCVLGNHLVADHPEIGARLAQRAANGKVTVIPYGARLVSTANAAYLEPFGLTPGGYAIVIARPEPENSILEIVRAFSAAPRPVRLVLLGTYRSQVAYQRRVLEAASDQVVFAGPVYERDVVDALRFHARLYVHGHTVGGTNPALVEAMGAGAPILAHDNRFNRWVAGCAAAYFTSETECASSFRELLASDGAARLADMRTAARARHADAFVLNARLAEYEELIAKWVPAGAVSCLHPESGGAVSTSPAAYRA